MPDVVVCQLGEGIARYWAVGGNLVASNEEAAADALIEDEKWLEGLLTEQ